MFIQMVTALVLQLIQCVVHLPSDRDSLEDEYSKKVRRGGEGAHQGSPFPGGPPGVRARV